MRKISALFASVLSALFLTGCDAEGDAPIYPSDIALVGETCAVNGGLQYAERALPAFSSELEWRVRCNDGALFVRRLKQAT